MTGLLNLLKRFFGALIGAGNSAMDKVENKGVIAKENLEIMKSDYEKKAHAIADLEAKVIILKNDCKKAETELNDLNQKIDVETAKYAEMPEGEAKDKLKTVIEAYIKKHSDQQNIFDGFNLNYQTQQETLNGYKEELVELKKQVEEAKFSTSQIEISEKMNNAKSSIIGNKGFNSAQQKINELKSQVNEQELSNKAYKNLGKSQEDLLIQDHEQELKKVNVSDEFAKRLAKVQK